MKLTILFQLRLTETNPAPPVIHAFTIEGRTNTQLKGAYKHAVRLIGEQFPQYKYAHRIAVFEDKSDFLRIIGIAEPPVLDEEE